jgi:hypothetical protein
MQAQIAILGWGSLLWDVRPEFDEQHGDWRPDGPTLKLEFSRVSSTRLGALTLVIDPEHGVPTTVAWCLSRRNDPDDAVADLRCREGCPIRYIARLNVVASVHDKSLVHDDTKEIATWAHARRIAVVLWTSPSKQLRGNGGEAVLSSRSHALPQRPGGTGCIQGGGLYLASP